MYLWRNIKFAKLNYITVKFQIKKKLKYIFPTNLEYISEKKQVT